MIKAIAFDAFGTLVHIGDRRRVMERIAASGQATPGRNGMTMPLGPYGLAKHHLCDYHVFDELDSLEQELYYEVASVRPYTDAIPLLDWIKTNTELKIAIISNLGMPFGIPLQTLFHSYVDEFVLSYDVGTVKPSKEIYHVAATRLEVDPSEILMVGDTYEHDVTGAVHSGLRAVHLDRSGEDPRAIANLYALIWILAKETQENFVEIQ